MRCSKLLILLGLIKTYDSIRQLTILIEPSEKVNNDLKKIGPVRATTEV